MYKYSIKPWKVSESNQSLSVKSVSTDFISQISQEKCQEEEELKQDYMADTCDGLKATTDGIPAVQRTGCPGQGGGGGSRGVSAKDKRKIREKRRSTGVARVNEIFGDESRDEETHSNTTINEAIQEEGEPGSALDDAEVISGQNVSNIDPSNQIHSVTSDHSPTNSANQIAVQRPLSVQSSQTELSQDENFGNSCPTSQESTEHPCGSLGASQTSSITSPSNTIVKSCLKRPPPPIGQKPILRSENSVGKLHSAHTETKYSTSCQSDDINLHSTQNNLSSVSSCTEKERLRVVELEKLVLELEQRLAEEAAKNCLLSGLLLKKDATINDLTQAVDALNQDLDMADEEYEKLEAENRAILRTLANLQVQAAHEDH